ncbi:MAG TPA: MAPEG family protein [Sphingomicrobium sp.]|nr:MAPEG family protein [Sphingomicrobium sp.]
MPVEIKIAALGALLLLVHIFAAVHLKTKQYGRTWNVGARDEVLPPLNPVAGRLARAQANFQETFPIAIVALLGVVIAGRASSWTALGGWIWLGARIIYLPLYGLGVPVWRTATFAVSIVGLVIVIWPLLVG